MSRPLPAVSWPAVAAGAVVSCALTLVLLAFGTGLGLSVVSPWSGSGVSATTFKIGTGLYLVVIAMLASSIGGYIAGRLRTQLDRRSQRRGLFPRHRSRLSCLGVRLRARRGAAGFARKQPDRRCGNGRSSRRCLRGEPGRTDGRLCRPVAASRYAGLAERRQRPGHRAAKWFVCSPAVSATAAN